MHRKSFLLYKYIEKDFLLKTALEMIFTIKMH